MANHRTDLLKLHRAEYITPKEPALVETGPAIYLSIDGMGEPGGEVFTKRVKALYAVAFTVKMSKKVAGQDYVISKLEALWWGVKGPGDFSTEPMSDWNWKLMIRTPVFVSAVDVQEGIAACQKKKRVPEVAKVRLETIQEGLCVQVLHVGPYSKVGETVTKMNSFAEEKGLSFHGLHHEIYISDPRRVPPERLKTILRMPVLG